MTIDINYYRKISGIYGVANKQEYERNIIASDFDRNFESSIAYEDVLINGVAKGVIIQKASIQNNIRDIMKITMQPGDNIVVGDIINWKNINWLCVQSDNVHDIYYYGNIQECKHVLKYYDDNMTLYTKPYVMYDGDVDEENNKFITLSSDEYILYCRNEADTEYINENTRFILGKEAYKVIGINSLTKIGLLEIKVKKDGITADDRVDLGIADWGKNQIIKSIVINNSNTASLLYQNSTLQLVVECKNNNVIVTSPVVTYSSNAINVATVSTNGLITAIGTGTAVITATYGNVNDTITITSVEVVFDDYNVNISPIDNTIIVGKSKIFTATILNNGEVETGQSCLWSLLNSDGTSIPYATKVANGLNCTITVTNKSNLIGKYIKLRSTFVEDENVYAEREIKIIGLL